MDIKFVNKPWGHELWIADGESTPYALKRIFFKEGNRTSLQVHKFKFETNYVLSGSGKLFLSEETFDIDSFINNGMSPEEVEMHRRDHKEALNYALVGSDDEFDYVMNMRTGEIFKFAPTEENKFPYLNLTLHEIGRAHV